MQPAGFLCPECSVPLRLRDRSQYGREIDCPDCGARLRIVADAGEVRAVPAAQPQAPAAPRPPGSTRMLRLVWGATACLGVAIVWITSRPGTSDSPAESEERETTAFEQAPPVEKPVVADEPTVTPTAEPTPEPATEVATPAPPPVPEPPKVETPQVAAAVADEKPILPQFAPDLPTVDVAAQLSLRLEEYSQTRPVEVRLLLRQIAELSAVPVDLSAVEKKPWKARLDQAISVELKQTTIGGLLKEILRQAGLAYEPNDGVIHITPPPMEETSGS